MAGVPGADVPLGGWNEPAIAVNPTNSLNIAYASLFELRVSTDGGTTWQESVYPQVPGGYVANGDPSLAFDSQGRLFWSYLGSPLGAYITFLGTDILVAQCDPATGEILPGYPVNVTAGIGLPGSAGNSHDKEWLAADFHSASPFADRLYLVWTNFPPGGDPVVLTTRSSNQGMTWSGALQLGTTGGAFNWPVHNTTAPNGNVYVAYHRQTGFVGNAPDGVSGLVRVFRSTDGGASYVQMPQAFTAGQADMTFNVQTTIAPIPGAEFWLQGSVQPWVLADPNVPGRIYVVANDDPDNNVTSGDAADVFIVRSTDSGSTWSPPMRVDRGPGTTFQVMPTASIDPVTGAIAVHYYDNRNAVLNDNGNFVLDVFATVSVDGGVSFGQDFQINDQPFDPDAGARCRFDCGEFISDVWTDAGGDTAYAVSLSGHFLSYSGGNWTIEAVTGAPRYAVWGSSPTDVFLCGPGGAILHFDGNQLTAQNSNTTRNLFGLDGRSGSDVFAVGAVGTVVHYNGSIWTPLSSGTVKDLHDVWANPTGNVFVAGDDGTVLEYDGSWADRSPGTGEVLWGVWGSGDDNVYVTGGSGESGAAVHRWNGTVWNAIDIGLAAAIGVWGSSMTDIVILGFGRIRHFDGSIWSPEDASEHILLRLHGSGPSNVFAVGEAGFIAHYDGSNWTPQTNPLMPPRPTKRVGEYNGVATAGGRSFAVWCGNTLAQSVYGGPAPHDQQTIFDDFETDWQTGISVVDLMHRAADVVLEPPTPNPVHRSTTVAYSLPRSETVDLSLVDTQGRRVATLVHGRQPSGRHVALWNGQSADGQDVAAGVYFLRLSAGEETRAQRVTFIP